MSRRGVIAAETWLCQAIDALRNERTAAPGDLEFSELEAAIENAENALERIRRAALSTRTDTMPVLELDEFERIVRRDPDVTALVAQGVSLDRR